MRVCFATLGVLFLVPLLSAMNSQKQSPLDTLRVDLGPVPDFALTEASGRTVRRDDLKGKVWVAAFFFTCCAGDCPTLSQSLAHLQKQLADMPEVRLVSF